MEEAQWNVEPRPSKTLGVAPREALGRGAHEKKVEVEEDGDGREAGTGISGDNSSRLPGAIPVPESPSLSVRALSSPPLSVPLPPFTISYDQNCEQSQAPVADRTPCYGITW